MPRHREGLSRKQTYGISLRDEEHEALSTIGGGSLTAGVSWLMETILVREPDKPEFRHVREVRAAFVKHQKEVAAAKAQAAADLERARAAKKAAKGPTKAEKELAEAVAHYDAINAKRFAAGEPLYDMTHLGRNPELVAAVYANARTRYGWERGPRPVELGGAPMHEPNSGEAVHTYSVAEQTVFAPGPDPGPPGSDELQKSNTDAPESAAPTENVQPEHSSVQSEHGFMQAGNNSMQPGDSRPDPAESGPPIEDAAPGEIEGHEVQEPQF